MTETGTTFLKIIIHANDTDHVVIFVYYASKLLTDVSELWARPHKSVIYLPIHGIAAALGPSTSRALPVIHSLGGRDTTSYSYFTGKKTWSKSRSMQIDIPAFEDFADGDQGPARITAEVVKQAKSS